MNKQKRKMEIKMMIIIYKKTKITKMIIAQKVKKKQIAKDSKLINIWTNKLQQLLLTTHRRQ